MTNVMALSAADVTVVRIIMSPSFRDVPGRTTVTVWTRTVGAAVEGLVLDYPTLRPALCDSAGAITRHVLIRLNGTDIRFLSGGETYIRSCDTISISARSWIKHLAVVQLPALVIAGAFGLFLHWIGFESPRIWLSLAASVVAVMIVLGLCKMAGAKTACLIERFGCVAIGLVLGDALGVLLVILLPSHWILRGLWGLLVIVGFLVGLAAPRFRLAPAPTRLGTLGAILGTVAVVWFGIACGGVVYDSRAFGAAAPSDQILSERRAARADRLSKWNNGSIAVTLSGGGYRAAIVEAGILAVFDKANLPIACVSTVSGGSIVGAAYALGWTPEEFVTRLRNAKPHMADDFLRPWLLHKLIIGDIGTGDIYVEHLARTYFSSHVIEDTGPPQLVVNATEMYEGLGEAFWANDSHHKAFGRELAIIVGASGAFPGAFSPIWIMGRHYADGGVVDNLGLEGLEQYLEEAAPSPPTPRVLVICDISAPLPQFSRAQSPLQAAMRAISVQSSARLEDVLYPYLFDPTVPVTREASKHGRIPRWTDGVPANRFWRYRSDAVFVAYLTSRTWVFSTDRREADALRHVAELGTLIELDSRDVDLGYWVGQRLALNELADVCEALGYPCPVIELPPLPP